MKLAKQWCEETGLSEWRPRPLDKASQESAEKSVALIQADALRHAANICRNRNDGFSAGWIEREAEQLESQAELGAESPTDNKLFDEILSQWKLVQKDRMRRMECLERTGPGESPYSRGQEEAWDMREHCLARTLLASMPEIAPLLQPSENQLTKP